jgi:uncharacterized membrane protein
MRLILFVHILAGSFALIFGYVALYSVKGAPLHRRTGMLFVYAMLTMGFWGALIAAVRGVAPAINIPSAALSAYLVITALATVRPTAAWPRWMNTVLMLVALAVGLSTLTFAFQAIANGGKRDGIPPFPFFMFAVIGLLASALDLRMIRSGGLASLKRATRLARHLWRMCFALFLAAMAFFIGQAQVFPKPLRIMPLLAFPMLAVLVTMFYWLWRVRARRSLHGIAGVTVAVPGTPSSAVVPIPVTAS